MERAKNIPPKYLKMHCLKGIRAQEGKFLIKPELQKNIRFLKVNLLESNDHLGTFDIIFLRNVMIYFDLPTRKKVIGYISSMLNENGLLLVGHAESLIGVTDKMKALKPTIYKKV
jgi:chemotaxis protein methyltransferase CheR